VYILKIISFLFKIKKEDVKKDFYLVFLPTLSILKSNFRRFFSILFKFCSPDMTLLCCVQ